MDFFRSFDAQKLRLKLKLAETRIDLAKNKKTNEIKKQKIEIANLLRGKQEELARIRTEHLVCDDFRIEVLGILGLLCALLKERTKLLENSKEIPYDMKESCATLVFAADRVNEIVELSDIKHQLMLKFKRELQGWLATEETCRESVNARVFDKLSVKPPNAFIVTSYMKFIAEEAKIDWQPREDFSLRTDLPSAAPRGITINPGAGSGIQTPYLVNDGNISAAAAYMNREDDFSVPKMFDDNNMGGRGGGNGGGGGGGSMLGAATIAAAKKSNAHSKSTTDSTTVLEFNPRPQPPLPPPVTSFGKGGDGTVPEFDELQARFNALRNE